MDIDSVLVANRGEIAVRVVRACRLLGLRSVAVYTDADAGALHTRLADTAVRIGSYLSTEDLLGAADTAHAVHPGYGMLAESAEFAAAVQRAGLVWVGPSPEVIATMGDKVAAREAATRCGVPVLPGAGPVDQATAAELAARIGFPLLVKAAHGGGGRGMRVAGAPDELAGALTAASREATAAFGRGEVFLERYLARPRHVEVQVLGDAAGVLHLGDRDCSVQRRHQKLIEEAPAPALPDAVRTGLRDAAVRLATAVGYTGAGTVEFLVDGTEYYFLEMNTRLQVEHGVTELVTGVDLVAAQLRVAGGQPLGLAQHDITLRGHAIQARIAAEDPWRAYLPAPGRIVRLTLPGGPGVRCDFGYAAGDCVPGDYDSLLGKVHAAGADRDTARARLGAALDELVVHGVATTAPHLRTVLDQPEFAAAEHDTGSLERSWAPEPGTGPVTETTGGMRRATIHTDRGPVTVAVPVRAAARRSVAAAGQRDATVAGPVADGAPVAPMDATVVSVPVAVGDRVRAGAVLVVLEAMKMELPVRAAADGEVTGLRVGAGSTVSAGDLLVDLG